MDDLSPKLQKMLQVDFDYFFPNTKVVIIPKPVNLCTNYMETLKGWLGGHFDATKLLWRGSRDGFTAKAFHKRCDKQGATLTVIKSVDGWIFGGYNPSSWLSTDPASCHSANGSFLFTLKNLHGISPTQFFCKTHCRAFYNDASSGPHFGCSDLVVLASGSNSSYFPNAYEDTTGKGKSILTKMRYSRFDVKEIEVYSV